MEAYGLTAHLDWQTPPAIDEAELRRVHMPEYIEVVRQLSASAPIMDAHRWGFSPYGDNPPFVGMWEAALAYTRATVAAAYVVRDGAPLAINITGGLHHALPNHHAACSDLQAGADDSAPAGGGRAWRGGRRDVLLRR